MLSLGMGATAAVAAWARPNRRVADERPGFDLAALAPPRFAAWRVDPAGVVVVAPPDQQAALDRLYNQTLARAYVGARGERVMLCLAYGADQSDGLSVHLPEVCYAGQGFRIDRVHDASLVAAGQGVPVRRLMTQRGRRHEPVSYWITTCGEATVSAWRRRMLGLREGLRRRIPDALLVRASCLDIDAERGWRMQASFMDALAATLQGPSRQMLIGEATTGSQP